MSRTSLRMRVLPRFPARIVGTDGIKVEQESNGAPDLIVRSAFDQLGDITSVPDPNTNYFMMWDKANNYYRRIPFQGMFDSAGVANGFPTIDAAEAANISIVVHAIEVYGSTTVGDGLGGLYIDVNNGASETFISGDGRTWYLAADVNPGRLTPATVSMFLQRYFSRAAAIAATVGAPVLSIAVQQGNFLLFFVRDAAGTALTTADGGTWSPLGNVYPEHFAQNTTPGTTDMTAACQAAIDWSAAKTVDGIFAQTVYGVTGLVWKEGASFEGAGNWSGQTFGNSTLGTTVFRYIGAGGANSCVIRFSKLAVGVEGTAATGNMSNMGLRYVTIDGNMLAEFGGYWNRSWSNSQFDYITASNCLKHGLWAGNCWGGAHKNWLGYKNRGCGITLGINTFGWAQCVIDQSVCISFFGYYSGYGILDNGASAPPVSAFSDATPDLEYGIGLGSHRALVLINPQANECSGAGIYRGPGDYSPLSIIGGYVENNGRSINATRRWDIWYISSPSALNDTIKGMHFGVATTGAVKITGSPSTGRIEACLKIMDCPIIGTIDADHKYYRLIDSDRDPVAMVGTKPTYFRERLNDAMNLTPIGQVVFWVNAGAIAVVHQEGAITGVTYNAVGDYTLTISETQISGNWIAIATTPGDNRYMRAADYTSTVCRLYHKSLTNVAADPTASNIALRVVVYGYLT